MKQDLKKLFMDFFALKKSLIIFFSRHTKIYLLKKPGFLNRSESTRQTRDRIFLIICFNGKNSTIY